MRKLVLILMLAGLGLSAQTASTKKRVTFSEESSQRETDETGKTTDTTVPTKGGATPTASDAPELTSVNIVKAILSDWFDAIISKIKSIFKKKAKESAQEKGQSEQEAEATAESAAQTFEDTVQESVDSIVENLIENLSSSDASEKDQLAENLADKIKNFSANSGLSNFETAKEIGKVTSLPEKTIDNLDLSPEQIKELKNQNPGLNKGETGALLEVAGQNIFEEYDEDKDEDWQSYWQDGVEETIKELKESKISQVSEEKLNEVEKNLKNLTQEDVQDKLSESIKTALVEPKITIPQEVEDAIEDKAEKLSNLISDLETATTFDELKEKLEKIKSEDPEVDDTLEYTDLSKELRESLTSKDIQQLKDNGLISDIDTALKIDIKIREATSFQELKEALQEAKSEGLHTVTDEDFAESISRLKLTDQDLEQLRTEGLLDLPLQLGAELEEADTFGEIKKVLEKAAKDKVDLNPTDFLDETTISGLSNDNINTLKENHLINDIDAAKIESIRDDYFRKSIGTDIQKQNFEELETTLSDAKKLGVDTFDLISKGTVDHPDRLNDLKFLTKENLDSLASKGLINEGQKILMETVIQPSEAVTTILENPESVEEALEEATQLDVQETIEQEQASASESTKQELEQISEKVEDATTTEEIVDAVKEAPESSRSALMQAIREGTTLKQVKEPIQKAIQTAEHRGSDTEARRLQEALKQRRKLIDEDDDEGPDGDDLPGTDPDTISTPEELKQAMKDVLKDIKAGKATLRQIEKLPEKEIKDIQTEMEATHPEEYTRASRELLDRAIEQTSARQKDYTEEIKEQISGLSKATKDAFLEKQIKELYEYSDGLYAQTEDGLYKITVDKDEDKIDTEPVHEDDVDTITEFGEAKAPADYGF